MKQPHKRAAALAAVSAFLVTAGGWTLADDPKPKGAPDPKLPKADANRQRVAGVIIKVEHPPTDEGKAGETKKERHKHRRARLVTINTAAEWRDYVRDQAPETGKRANRKDAAKGRDGIAAKGEPVSKDTTVVIDADPDTTLEVRFRASDDETSAGSTTPAGAADAEKNLGSGKDGRPQDKGRPKAMPVRLNELKSGLFVEVDYKHEDGCDKATKLTVIKPVGGPNTEASEPGKSRGAERKKD